MPLKPHSSLEFGVDVSCFLFRPKIWMNVRRSSITASSCASTPSEASPASAPLASHSTRLPVSVSKVQGKISVTLHRKINVLSSWKRTPQKRHLKFKWNLNFLFLLSLQTTTSVPLRIVGVVPGLLVSTRLVASTVNALKVSRWTTQAWSVKVSS